MRAHRDLLELAGTFMADLPTASIEWSLQVTAKAAVVRDRVLFAVGQREYAGNSAAFTRVEALLRTLGAPDEMLAVQRRLAPHSVRQGLGLIPGKDAAETCLYIHHIEPDSGIEHCDAWKWVRDGVAVHSFYEFHFLASTPAGPATADLVHEDLRPLYRVLESEERVRAISGFWLRHNGGRIDQISLTYPWQPTVGSVLPVIEHLMPLSDHCIEALKPWHGHHFRHVAMNAPPSEKPSLTFYFSGHVHGQWPAGIAQMHERVRRSAQNVHKAIESGLSAGAAGNRSLLV